MTWFSLLRSIVRSKSSSSTSKRESEKDNSSTSGSSQAPAVDQRTTQASSFATDPSSEPIQLNTETSVESEIAVSPDRLDADDTTSVSSSAITEPLQLDKENEIVVVKFDAISDDLNVISKTLVASADKIKVTFPTEATAPSVPKTTPFLHVSNRDAMKHLKRDYDLPTFDDSVAKEPFTSNFDIMDDMFEGVLTMKSFPRTKVEAKNVETVAPEPPSGVKVRDFAASIRTPPVRDIDATDEEATPPVPENRAIELFRAHRKALHYFYWRFLLNSGIYDLPPYNFTVDDMDRLYTCGVIKNADIDNPMLASMLGHGAYRRSMRTYGISQVDKTVPPPRGPWTVPINFRRPTKEEIYAFIYGRERERLRKPYASVTYRIAAFERPVLTVEYLNHRFNRFGLLGLKCAAGLSDEEVRDMINELDTTFIRPETYLAKKNAALEAQDTEPLLSNVAETQAPQAGPSNAASSSHSASPLPRDTEIPPSVVERGRDQTPKGKKRARSPSPPSEQADSDSARRTRARLSDEQPGTPATTNPSPRAERGLRRSTRRVTERVPTPTIDNLPVRIPETPVAPSPKGKKRARDDEVEPEIPEGSSPTKKVKAAGGLARAAPAAAESSSAPSVESSVKSTTPAEPGPSNAPQTTPPQRRPLVRQSTMRYDKETDRFVDLAKGKEKLSEAVCSEVPANTEQAPADRPQRRPLVRQSTLGQITEAGEPSNLPKGKKSGKIIVRVVAPPDTEKGPLFAYVDRTRVNSWAALCSRERSSAPPQTESESSEAQSQAKVYVIKTLSSTTTDAQPRLDAGRSALQSRHKEPLITWPADTTPPSQSQPAAGNSGSKSPSKVPVVEAPPVTTTVVQPQLDAGRSGSQHRGPLVASPAGTAPPTQSQPDAGPSRSAPQSETPAGEEDPDNPDTWPFPRPVRRGLQRQHMRYLDEVFPEYHPHYYGRTLVREPMRYLDEVLPDIFPRWIPPQDRPEGMKVDGIAVNAMPCE